MVGVGTTWNKCLRLAEKSVQWSRLSCFIGLWLSAPLVGRVQSWDGPEHTHTAVAGMHRNSEELCLRLANHISEANLTVWHVLKTGYSFEYKLQEEKYPILPAYLNQNKSQKTFFPFAQVEGCSVLVGSSFASDSPLQSWCIAQCNLDLDPPPAHLWGFLQKSDPSLGKGGIQCRDAPRIWDPWVNLGSKKVWGGEWAI